MGIPIVAFIIVNWYYGIIELQALTMISSMILSMIYLLVVSCATLYEIWSARQQRKIETVESIYIPTKKGLSKVLKIAEAWLEISRHHIDLDIEELWKFIESPKTPKGLKANLIDIKQSISRYNEWLSEAGEIISYNIRREVSDKLREYWNLFDITPTIEATIKSHAQSFILDGKLSPELVKNNIFGSYSRDAKPLKESKEIKKLKDVFESESFYRLIRSLKKLENRLVIVTVRKMRKDLLNKINETIKWLSEQMK